MSAAPAPHYPAIRTWLTARIAEAVDTPVQDVDTTSPFYEFGIASRDAIEISGRLGEFLGRDLEPTLFYEHPTIDSMSAALAEEQHETPPGLVEQETAEQETAEQDTGEHEDAPEHDAAELGSDRDDVAVLGLACRFPRGATSPDAFWSDLLAGRDGGSEIPSERWDADAHHDDDPSATGSIYTRRGGFVEDVTGFDAAFFGLSPAEAFRMEPQQRMLLEATWAALENAGLAPDRLRGSRTGVFVGQMTSQEYDRLQHDHEGDGVLDDPYFGSGISPSVTAGRIAYLFDLRGPAVCLDTACSSSLTALHLADRSLRRGECDVAVVAGASAMMHPTGMAQACRAHMLAPDGRCKTFDAAADGFMMGEGCGVVVLSRVSDAPAERVRAVVRGTAMSQDGRSNGLTAPRLGAQVEVISEALRVADVAPGEVGYVEAHGSGTQLGDAIEIGALQKVFADDRTDDRPLAVGAVKTNVGHLLGAAGVAGLIKTVLALEHGVVPPNLHLTDRNPSVDWERMPMLLPDAVHEWPLPGPRRVAGLSSFGWSGTNVHVVLESAPEVDDAGGGPDWEILLLSAHTPEALAELSGRLGEDLGDLMHGELADAARTLAVGRSSLSYRQPVVARGLPEALEQLETARTSGGPRHVRPGTALRPVFLFPGAGDQHPDMGGEIYRTEPAFAEAFDRCADVLLDEVGTDLRSVLWQGRSTGGGLADALGRTVPEPADGVLDQPEIAHAAVFAVEYAMARLWQHWGVTPAAMLGYSLGEYAAACLAGVFDPDDVVRLLCRRGRAIARTEPGAMLAVPLPADEVRAMLPDDLSTAAENGPSMTVVSGPTAAVARFETRLDGEDVVHRRVGARHALHSRVLEAVRAEVTDLLREIPRGTPEIPFVSSLTGDWITDDQAADPGYWARQMCETVQFSRAVDTVTADGPGALVEIGPGQTLTSLALQIVGPRADGTVAAPTMRVPHLPDSSDREQVLRALGTFWAHGGRVDWTAVRGHGHGRLRSLPTYPFDHTQRFDPGPAADVRGAGHAAGSGGGTAPGKLADLGRWSHVPVWQQSLPVAAGQQAGGRWLVFADSAELYRPLAEELARRGASVVTVHAGDGFGAWHDDAYTIDPHAASDYDTLVDTLAAADRLPDAVLHTWTVPEPDRPAARSLGHYSLLDLFRAMAGHLTERTLRCVVLTSGLHRVVGSERTDPRAAPVLGFAPGVAHEFPGSSCRCIDVVPTELSGKETVRALADELHADADGPVAYRAGHRWTRRWEPTPLEPVEHGEVWRDGGVYVITGGLGGLGLALARRLADRKARLVLLGRTAVGEPGTDDDDGRAAAVRDLEERGAEVMTAAVDVADRQALEPVLAAARERFGPPNGVIHAAGVPAGGLIALKKRGDAERVLRPKVEGTVALRKCLSDVDLDFFVLYSSSLVSTGGLGETDYCAANAYLDAFAWHARESGLPVTALDWGPWTHDSWTGSMPNNDGMAAAMAGLRERYGITEEEGVEVLTRAVARGVPEVLVSTQDPEVLAEQWRAITTRAAEGVPSEGSRHPRPALGTPYVAPRGRTEQRIVTVWQRFLGLDRVGANDHFFELGGNSLIGMTVTRVLGSEFEVDLKVAELFEAPTPATLAEAIGSRSGGGRPDRAAGTRTSGGDRARRRRDLAGGGRRGRRRSHREEETA